MSEDSKTDRKIYTDGQTDMNNIKGVLLLIDSNMRNGHNSVKMQWRVMKLGLLNTVVTHHIYVKFQVNVCAGSKHIIKKNNVACEDTTLGKVILTASPSFVCSGIISN